MRRTLQLAALGAILLLSGCQTGKRATLQPIPPVNDPNVAPIVDDLTKARTGTFTAEYKITPTSTGSAVKAKVVNAGGVYEATIGETGYTTDGTTAQTCTSASCESGFNDSYISDLNVTHIFWATSFEARLRTDSQRNIGTTTASTKTIAGVPVHCVTVPLVGGSVEYCTIPGGPLASYTGADVAIELTSYRPSVDEPAAPAAAPDGATTGTVPATPPVGTLTTTPVSVPATGPASGPVTTTP